MDLKFTPQQLLHLAALSPGQQSVTFSPKEPQLRATKELKYADLLVQLYGYWKSKVFEVHCSWKEVTAIVDVNKLDKRNLPAEKYFEGRKMPTFKLGKRVKVVAEDKRQFKILHKKVAIWREGLTELIGKEAIVMNLSSRYAIGIALVDNGEMHHVHGFALEAVEDQSEEGIWQNKTQFHRDDEVVIGVDNVVLANLQRNARKTPYNQAAQLVGYIARVICIFRGEVCVTFDEIHHELFNRAALKPYNDRESGQKKLIAHSTDKDVRLGSKVTVTPNLSRAMDLQRGHGEWSYKMTKFVGKEGSVVDILPGGDLIIKFSPFESHVMNRQALNFERKKHRNRNRSGNEIILDKQTPFMAGDIVRLNIEPNDLMSNLQLLRIPREFATIITDCMEFIGYVDKVRGVVDLGDGAELTLNLGILTKVQSPLSDEYKRRRLLDKGIGVGDEVVLFIGPKTFVETCIDSAEFKTGFEKAMEETAKVEGYDDDGQAVIRYSDRKLYKVPDEYLCSPRVLWRTFESGKVGFVNWSSVELTCAVSGLENSILHCLTEALEDIGSNDALGWNTTIRKIKERENAKSMDVQLPCRIENCAGFFEKFKGRLEAKKLLCESVNGVLVVTVGYLTYEIIFTHGSEILAQDETVASTHEAKDASIPKVSFQDSVPTTPTDLGRSLSVNDILSEPEVPNNAAIPFGTDGYTITIPQGVKHIALQFGGTTQATPIQRPAPSTPAANLVPPTVMNPAAQTIINMYGDGENKVNIDKSYVRAIKQQSS